MTTDSHARQQQFDALPQQREASEFGIWVFLATEVLFFGGLFLAYAIYRGEYPEAFAHAGARTDLLLGTINTSLLLTSSFVVTLAIRTVKEGNLRICRLFVRMAIALGVAFLAVKGYEYHNDLAEGLVPGVTSTMKPGPERIFFTLYWIMTAVHAVHLAIGIGTMAAMSYFLKTQPDIMRETSRLEVAGLYWHFVDVIWIFLYPLLYLMGRVA